MSYETTIVVNDTASGHYASAMAAYLADYLNLKLESQIPSIEEQSDAADLIADGILHTGFEHGRLENIGRIYGVRPGRIVIETASRRYARHDSTPDAGTLYISIFNESPMARDQAKYMVARALADIQIPHFYMECWGPTIPLEKPKLTGVVLDSPEPPAGGEYNYYHHRAALSSRSTAIAMEPMVPIIPNQTLTALIRKLPLSKRGSVPDPTVGLDYTARLDAADLTSDPIFVRLLTINGTWGILHVTDVTNNEITYAFDRRFIYDLVAFCGAVNNGVSLIDADGDNAFQRVIGRLLRLLAALNKTQCTNRLIDSFTLRTN